MKLKKFRPGFSILLPAMQEEMATFMVSKGTTQKIIDITKEHAKLLQQKIEEYADKGINVLMSVTGKCPEATKALQNRI